MQVRSVAPWGLNDGCQAECTPSRSVARTGCRHGSAWGKLAGRAWKHTHAHVAPVFGVHDTPQGLTVAACDIPSVQGCSGFWLTFYQDQPGSISAGRVAAVTPGLEEIWWRKRNIGLGGWWWWYSRIKDILTAGSHLTFNSLAFTFYLYI